jgi:esterase/lipase
LVDTQSHEQMIQASNPAVLAIAILATAATARASVPAQGPGGEPSVLSSPRSAEISSYGSPSAEFSDSGRFATPLTGASLIGASLIAASPSGDAEPPPFTTRKAPIKVEEVLFKTRDKLTIHADFYPSRKRGRAPAALLVHDAGSDRTEFEDLAVSLQKRGFAVLAIDLRGHGESATKDTDWADLDDPHKIDQWAYSIRDLEAAKDFLRGRDDVHNANLSLVGVGAGAALAVRYAIDDESTRAVVLIDPRIEAYGFNMYKDVVGLEGLPTLVMIPSKRRAEATRMQKEAHRQNDGDQFVEIKSLRIKGEENPLSDSGIPRTVRGFLIEEAMPRR